MWNLKQFDMFGCFSWNLSCEGFYRILFPEFTSSYYWTLRKCSLTWFCTFNDVFAPPKNEMNIRIPVLRKFEMTFRRRTLEFFIALCTKLASEQISTEINSWSTCEQTNNFTGVSKVYRRSRSFRLNRLNWLEIWPTLRRILYPKKPYGGFCLHSIQRNFSWKCILHFRLRTTVHIYQHCINLISVLAGKFVACVITCLFIWLRHDNLSLTYLQNYTTNWPLLEKSLRTWYLFYQLK